MSNNVALKKKKEWTKAMKERVASKDGSSRTQTQKNKMFKPVPSMSEEMRKKRKMRKK